MRCDQAQPTLDLECLSVKTKGSALTPEGKESLLTVKCNIVMTLLECTWQGEPCYKAGRLKATLLTAQTPGLTGDQEMPTAAAALPQCGSQARSPSPEHTFPSVNRTQGLALAAWHPFTMGTREMHPPKYALTTHSTTAYQSLGKPLRGKKSHGGGVSENLGQKAATQVLHGPRKASFQEHSWSPNPHPCECHQDHSPRVVWPRWDGHTQSLLAQDFPGLSVSMSRRTVALHLQG